MPGTKKNHKLVATAFIKVDAESLTRLGVRSDSELAEIAEPRLQQGLEQLLRDNGLTGTVSLSVQHVR